MQRKERNESMYVRQQYRKTGKKYTKGDYCIYPEILPATSGIREHNSWHYRNCDGGYFYSFLL